MDKLKLYAAPIVALVVILAWYFVIRPKLDAGALDEGKGDGKAPQQQPAGKAAPAEAPPAQRVQ
ncbi:MAG: hypothetical protein KC457_26605 [Myxococcales bacterium]|nr:hypothetical protein [Myxococcales bacterium]